MKTNTYYVLRIILGIGIILLVFLSALPLIPLRVVPEDAPASRFSAERAMTDLQVVASVPHAAGSTAQEQVRSYILSQAAALGLETDVQESGQISNILVRLPGTDPTLIVLVSGHYDSHPPAPGAGDNGISVAVMLETLRVLHAYPAQRNDILFLFTDGEELGWHGASAFISKNPQAKQEIGVALVFDARPGNAPLSLVETSPGDAWLIRQMTGLSLPLWAGSWNNREERLEQATDFDTFQASGYIGAVFENESNGTRYHTSRDTFDAISPSLVQAYGETMHKLVERFASIDLSTRVTGSDLVYFMLPVVGLLSYPGWVMSLLSALGVIALLIFIVIAWRSGSLPIKRFMLSALGFVLGVVLIVLGAQLAWGLILKAHAAEVSAYAGFETSAAWMSGLLIAASLLIFAVLTIMTRYFGELNVSTAVVLVYLLVSLAFFLFMDSENPLTTAYLAWPFLGGVAGIGVLLFTRNPVWKAGLLALSALVVLALLVPTFMMGRYTREDAWLPVLLLSLQLGAFAPQVSYIFGRVPVNTLTNEREPGSEAD